MVRSARVPSPAHRFAVRAAIIFGCAVLVALVSAFLCRQHPAVAVCHGILAALLVALVVKYVRLAAAAWSLLRALLRDRAGIIGLCSGAV